MINDFALCGADVRRVMRVEGVSIRNLAEVVASEMNYARPKMKLVRQWREKGCKAGIWAWEFNHWLEIAKNRRHLIEV